MKGCVIIFPGECKILLLWKSLLSSGVCACLVCREKATVFFFEIKQIQCGTDPFFTLLYIPKAYNKENKIGKDLKVVGYIKETAASSCM